MVQLLHVSLQVLHEMGNACLLQDPKFLQPIHIFVGDLMRSRETGISIPIQKWGVLVRPAAHPPPAQTPLLPAGRYRQSHSRRICKDLCFQSFFCGSGGSTGVAKGQQNQTHWITPPLTSLPQGRQDCPVSPRIPPSIAFPCCTEASECRDMQRADRKPAKGLFFGKKWAQGSPHELWDGVGLIHLPPAFTFPRAASSGKSMVCRWRRMRRIPSR